MTRQVYERTVHVWAIPHVITVHQKSKTVWVAVGDYMGERIEVKGSSADVAAKWVEAARFKAPGNGPGPGRLQIHRGLAKPNALLEQIWNTLMRSVLPASHTFGTLPSEELFPAHRRRQPLKPSDP